MVKFLVGLAALASVAFADITFSCIGYPATGNSIGVSVNGAITKLVANETTFPVWIGAVPGTTSAVEYKYVEINAAGTAVKSEAFTRKLNQTTDIATPNEFFDRPVTYWTVPRLPYTYLATYPSKSKAFKETQIATLHLIGDKTTVDALNLNPNSEAEARVTFRFINAKTIYTQHNISLTTSGKSSKEFSKQSYKIKFDTDYNQTFFSRPNIKLRSMATEPTMLREKMYIDTLNAVGVPTQQGSYVRLFINNEAYGLYLMVDDIKKSFLKQTVHGGDALVIPGALVQANAPSKTEQADFVYKGPLGTAYGRESYISQNLGNNPVTEPLGQLITFMKDLQDFDPVATADPVGYWNNTRLDLDGFLRNMALEYLFGGFDNYWMAGSNYFIYFNPKLGASGKWQWLPTDFDGTFGNGAEIDPKGSYKTLYNFQPDHPLVSKLIINNTAINALFVQVLKEIVSTTFKPEAMNPHIEGVHQMISADAQWDLSLTRKSPGKNLGFTFADFQGNLVNITKDMSGAIKPWVADRATAISTELAFTIPAGTADRVPPPPRNGGDNDNDDDATSPNDGKGSHSGAATVAASAMAVVAMVASSLMLLA
ncbi:hypothetical protein BGX33_011376 [Mortierella sp. NVP41]|nr:hypothetical protein BGX33_011376 [Mortierella sp. NVP41]